MPTAERSTAVPRRSSAQVFWTPSSHSNRLPRQSAPPPQSGPPISQRAPYRGNAPPTTRLPTEMTSNEPDATSADLTFADLQIHPSVLQAVADVGYESPSAIQAATIPAMMAGSDVVGLAQTGTGKTAAFAIPILSKIDPTNKATQALVLAPTRELALQVAEAFGRYGSHLQAINVLPIYGGSSYSVQLSGLRRGAQVVVGTPGRVIRSEEH